MMRTMWRPVFGYAPRGYQRFPPNLPPPHIPYLSLLGSNRTARVVGISTLVVFTTSGPASFQREGGQFEIRS
jgi:hypothetical protein